jgi:putative transposase
LLEPCAGKLARTVLRGRVRGNATLLPGGSRLVLVDPRKHRPSQTCPVSGLVRKKSLGERTHVLPDGRVITRDQASAWVLWTIGQELAAADRPVTSSRAA